jgi:hypothetical protein
LGVHYANVGFALPLWASRLNQVLLSRRFPLFCVLAFLVPRVLLIWLVPVEPVSDFAWYFNRARELAESGVYQEGGHPTAFWPIGYPAFLGLLFAVTGPSLLAAQVCNLVFGGAALWLTYKISKELFDDEAAARLAIALLALYPNNIGYAPLIATEPLYTVLLLGMCYWMLRPPSAARIVVCGLTIGFATLVKSQTALLAAVFVVCTLLWASSRAEVRSRLLAGAMMGVLALAVVAPWTVRNYLTFGTPVFVSTNGGISLLMANNPSMKGLWSRDFAPDDPLVEQAQFRASDQIAADRRARALAYEWIGQHPGEFIALIPQKVWRLWAPDGEAEWSFQASTPGYERHALWFRGMRILNQLFYMCAVALAAVALIPLLRSRAPGRTYIGYVVALFFTVLCAIFSGQSRYHFPIMPLLLIYAAWLCTSRRLPLQGFMTTPTRQV